MKLTLAVVAAMLLVARAVGAAQAGNEAAWVVKLTVAGAEVAPPAQLLTMFTVYAVPAVKPDKLKGEAVTVWLVVAGDVVTV